MPKQDEVIKVIEGLEKYDIVKLDWLDTISSFSDWTYESEIDMETEEKYMVHQAIGAFFGRTEQCIFLVSLYRPEDGTISNMLGTPIATIRGIELLKKANGKKTKTERRRRTRRTGSN
jgi:hypothetical protein